MQNDIVKPPFQPDQQAQPEPDQNNVGNEVRQPTQSESIAKDGSTQKLESQATPRPDTSLAGVQKPRRRKPIVAITAAAMVCLVLVAGVVYTTLLNQKNTSPVASNQSPSTQTSSVADNTTEIDAALDEAAQLPTSNEDPASDLSDQNLGL